MFSRLKKETVVSVYKPIEFPVINNDELAIELNVEVLAKQAARDKKPLTDSTQPDSNELNFRQEIETKGLQATHRINQSISDLRDLLLGMTVTKEVSEAEEMPNKFNAIVKAKLPAEISNLKTSCVNCRTYADHINNFKKENKLQRNASYPDSWFLTIGILLIALIIESFLNGIFFAEGSDSGLVGGIGLALVISGVNIITGFTSGLLVLRYKNHISNIKVSLSYITLLIISLLVLTFNLLVSHYREAVGNEPDNANYEAIESFKEGVFSISDVGAWLLFSIGIVFYILAIYKGYSADDEYPGFGKMARVSEQAEYELADYQEELISKFDELLEEYEERLEEIYEDVVRKSKQVNTYMSSFDTQNLIFRSYKRHLQSSLSYIVTLYRDINSTEREDSPPEYFNSSIVADLDSENMVIDYIDNRAEIVEIKDKLASSIYKIKSEMNKINEELHAEINKAGKT